jgi:transcriptional regulator with XRE-family HTH domain
MKQSEKFRRALAQLRGGMRLTQDELGGRLGVTRWTLTRWETRGELPPLAQQKHLLTVLADAPDDLYNALVDSLEVDQSFKALVTRRASAGKASGTVDSALLAMAEELDVSPVRLRRSLGAFLRCVHECGLSLESARALVGPKVAAASELRNKSLRALRRRGQAEAVWPRR